MINVRVICDDCSWETSINGSFEKAKEYFLGKTFWDEDCETGEETAMTVVDVKYLGRVPDSEFEEPQFPQLMESQQIAKYLDVCKLDRTAVLNQFLTDFGFLAETNKIYSKTEFLELVVNTSGNMKTIVGASVLLHSDFSIVKNEFDNINLS